MEEINQDNQVPVLYRLETFINGIAGSVYWKDINGVYIGCNNAIIEKGHLISKDNLIGKTDFDVWPDHAESLRKVDLEVIATGKTIETDETVILKTGEILYFSSIKSPLRDEAGNIVGIIGNSLDITELKQAKKYAEDASRAKTQFLALMSHELRIPLTGIISTASMLVDGDVTLEEAQDFGKIIYNSGHYLLSTIDNILDFAKLESNKLKMVSIPFHLKSLIDEITAIFRASAYEKKLKLKVKNNFDPTLCLVSDPRVIRHLLTNLINNAIKFTDVGVIQVTVNALEHTDQTVTLEMIVSDTGIGIPEDRLSFIFDRFSQIESPYTRRSSRQGTGLGLSIVKKLVELIDGSVSVKSKLGSGSEFKVTATFMPHSDVMEDNTKSQWQLLKDKLGIDEE